MKPSGMEARDIPGEREVPQVESGMYKAKKERGPTAHQTKTEIGLHYDPISPSQWIATCIGFGVAPGALGSLPFSLRSHLSFSHFSLHPVLPLSLQRLSEPSTFPYISLPVATPARPHPFGPVDNRSFLLSNSLLFPLKSYHRHLPHHQSY